MRATKSLSMALACKHRALPHTFCFRFSLLFVLGFFTCQIMTAIIPFSVSLIVLPSSV